MAVSTSDAMLAAASCNELLNAIDRLDVMVGQINITDDDRRMWRLETGMKEWILGARETVLDIKSRL